MAEGPKLKKVSRVVGRNLVFRRVVVSDAEFIMEMRRTAEQEGRLSMGAGTLDDQVEWLARYALDDAQTYFVILDSSGDQIGLVRLYDPRGTSFCMGSWVIQPGSPVSHALESMLMCYHFGLRMGFDRAHLDVRKNNTSVWRFHERFGARRVGETETDYLYSISGSKIDAAFERYRKYLPDGIQIYD